MPPRLDTEKLDVSLITPKKPPKAFFWEDCDEAEAHDRMAGSPCVGKTAVAERLFGLCEDRAYFDGDWGWCVNPFSLDDPRLRNGDRTIAFALSNYLKSGFRYVICPAVVVIGAEIRASVLRGIDAGVHTTVAFTLTCSEETLAARHRKRGDPDNAVLCVAANAAAPRRLCRRY